ncbi:MAG: hypothetical protein NTZ24_12675 [Deltaproteobacteria bacterium]|nr:hypothetical protein [Deltaproteobacteria bacterium]
MGSLALRAELPGKEKETVCLFYCAPDPRAQGGDCGMRSRSSARRDLDFQRSHNGFIGLLREDHE